MKRLGNIIVCLAGGLALAAGARAQNAVSADNPYGGIVERNVFGLNPVPPPDAKPPGDPPPKITPNGIMTIFGQLQVLFKVTNAKPGQPAKDTFYTLSEGESQDDIEVSHIDEQGSMVTFVNHGTLQQIPLANAPAIGPTAPGATPGPIRNFPGSRMPNRFGGGPGAAASSAMGYNANNAQSSGSRSYATPSYPNPSYVNPNSASPGYVNQQSQSHVTPEEQAILLEVQREQWKQEGNSAHMIIPPTPLTPQE